MRERSTFEEIVSFMIIPFAGLGVIYFMMCICHLIALIITAFIGG
jgi:hypothetical protein